MIQKCWLDYWLSTNSLISLTIGLLVHCNTSNIIPVVQEHGEVNKVKGQGRDTEDVEAAPNASSRGATYRRRSSDQMADEVWGRASPPHRGRGLARGLYPLRKMFEVFVCACMHVCLPSRQSEQFQEQNSGKYENPDHLKPDHKTHHIYLFIRRLSDFYSNTTQWYCAQYHHQHHHRNMGS